MTELLLFGMPAWAFITFMLLFMGVVASGIINFWLLTVTPARMFLGGRKRGRMLLIHPDKRKKVVFEIGKLQGSVIRTNDGFYDIDPNDVYIEEKSKSPTAIIYGMQGVSITPDMAKMADYFKERGVKNYTELLSMSEKNKDRSINLLGTSVPIQTAANYFNRNDRADLMEAEHQFRIAHMQIERQTDWNKWVKVLLFAGIFLVCAAIAYAMISQMQTGGIVDQMTQALNTLKGATAAVTPPAS